MSVDLGQVVTYAQDEIVETIGEHLVLSEKAEHYVPPAGSMQRSSNEYWKPIQQRSNSVDGWDVTGQETGLLELSVSGALDEPTGVYKTLRVDDTRDEAAIRRAMRADALELVRNMELRGIEKAVKYGAGVMPYSGKLDSSGGTSTWEALSGAEARLFDLEAQTDAGTCAFLNATVVSGAGKKLVESSANFGGNIPDSAYRKGLIQKEIAGIGEVYRHNKLPVLGAAAGGSLTVNGTVSLKPLANEVLPNGSKGNVDSRFGTIATNQATTTVAIGDKFKIAGCYAVSRGSNLVLDFEQTFTVVAKDTNELTVSPRPIALDDASLTDLEKKYATISTQIVDTDAIVWLNTTAAKSNVVMTNDAMLLASSPIPTSLDIFDGFFAKPFEVGPVQGMIGFETQLGKLTGQYRIAAWYDWQVQKPEDIIVILDGQ